MRSYTESLKTEAQKKKFNFPDFIKGLSSDKLYDFMKDFFSERTEHMWVAFPPDKNVSTHDIVFLSIKKLDDATYEKVRGVLDKILLSAITGNDSGNDSENQNVVENVLALTGMRREGVSAECIKGLLKDPSITEDLKLSLAFLLSQIKNTVPLYYWDEELNYDEQSYLIPAYISAFAKSNPTKALSILKECNKKPESEDLDYYRSPITSALENMLVTNGERRQYRSLYNKMSEWAKQIFKEILGTSRFEKIRDLLTDEDTIFQWFNNELQRILNECIIRYHQKDADDDTKEDVDESLKDESLKKKSLCA